MILSQGMTADSWSMKKRSKPGIGGELVSALRIKPGRVPGYLNVVMARTSWKASENCCKMASGR